MKGPGLDDADEVAVAVVDADLVEALFPEVHEVELEAVFRHRTRVPRQVRLHESNRGRVDVAVVDADVEDAVADDCILVRVHVGRFELGETERLVPEE